MLLIFVFSHIFIVPQCCHVSLLWLILGKQSMKQPKNFCFK